MTLFALSPKERTLVERLTVRGDDAKVLRRAQAVLGLDEGEGVQEVAERLRVSCRTIYNWVARFQGCHALDLAGRLADGERPGRPRTAQGIIDPLIGEVIARDPRELGYRSTGWTAPLLTQYLKEIHHLNVSRQSVSLALARLDLRWKRPRHARSQRPATWRQAKGGSNAGSARGSGPSS